MNSSCSDYIKHLPGYSCFDNNLLGKGNSGHIYLIIKDDIKRVLKVSKATFKARAEKDALLKLKGEAYIANIIDWKETKENMLLILNFGENGTLDEFLESSEDMKKPENVFIMFYKIFQGVMNIHKHHLVHADIKMENIVIDADNNPRIIDFDMAKEVDQIEIPAGTIEYMAPEIIKSFEELRLVYFSKSLDLYSFGAMLYMAMKKKNPIELDKFNYYTMMTYPVNFNKGDIKEFFDICSGLIKPLSFRLDEKIVLFHLKKATSSNKFTYIEEDFMYQMQDYASDSEFATPFQRYSIYYNFIIGLIVLNGFVMILFFAVKFKKQKNIDQLETIKNEQSCSSDLAKSMTTNDSLAQLNTN